MLLGTDIAAVLTTLDRARRRRDRAQLLDRPRGHARRDPLPRRALARCRSTASRTPACRCRAPTARRSSPRRPSSSPRCSASSSSATASASSAAAAGRRPSTSARSPSGSRAARPASARAGPPPLVSSMMTATDLVQEPRPTLVGERVNSQGSRKAKELLLADDYDGLVQVAEDQVDGRRPRARRLRRADRAPGRGRADGRGRQADLADPARADPDRLDRARGDRGRARGDPGPRDRQLDQPRGRPRQGRPGDPAGARRTAPR